MIPCPWAWYDTWLINDQITQKKWIGNNNKREEKGKKVLIGFSSDNNNLFVHVIHTWTIFFKGDGLSKIDI